MNYTLTPVCLIIAAIFLYEESKKNYNAAVFLKGLASLCFVILGVINYSGTTTSKLIVLGLLLGAVADVLLNLRWVFPSKGQLIFLTGILVFMGGHILYLSAILPLCKLWIFGAVGAVVLTVFLMLWIFKQITATLPFKIFGVVYIGIIVFLNCISFLNLVTGFSKFTLMFEIGAILFLVSDIILILNTFGGESKQLYRNLNIMLYYCGQLFIAFSLMYV